VAMVCVRVLGRVVFLTEVILSGVVLFILVAYLLLLTFFWYV